MRRHRIEAATISADVARELIKNDSVVMSMKAFKMILKYCAVKVRLG